LYIFDASGSFHVGDGGDLLGVGFDATMADVTYQKNRCAKFAKI
jgi:hypothetical protein